MTTITATFTGFGHSQSSFVGRVQAKLRAMFHRSPEQERMDSVETLNSMARECENNMPSLSAELRAIASRG